MGRAVRDLSHVLHRKEKQLFSFAEYKEFSSSAGGKV